MSVDRAGRSPQGRFEIGDIGVLPDINPIVAVGRSPAIPAEQAGLKAGDVILAVNGERMASRPQLIDGDLADHGGATIELTVRRDGSEQSRVGRRPSSAATAA